MHINSNFHTIVAKGSEEGWHHQSLLEGHGLEAMTIDVCLKPDHPKADLIWFEDQFQTLFLTLTNHILQMPLSTWCQTWVDTCLSCLLCLQHKAGPEVQPRSVRQREAVQANPQRKSDARHQKAARHGKATLPPQLSRAGGSDRRVFDVTTESGRKQLYWLKNNT